jgi:hypothetical protein
MPLQAWKLAETMPYKHTERVEKCLSRGCESLACTSLSQRLAAKLDLRDTSLGETAELLQPYHLLHHGSASCCLLPSPT